jgi:MraZ protein
MALFLSTYINKVDRKGRVSIPASFRGALSAAGAEGGVVLFRSHSHPCLEGFDAGLMDELSARLDHYDLFSAAQDDLATALFGEAVQLAVDADGRIILPPELLRFAAIDERAAFVGMGRKFQVWEPAAFEARREFARRNVREQGLTLPREGKAS